MSRNEPDRLHDWFDAVEPRSAPDDILDKVFAVTRRTGQRHQFVERVAETLLPREPFTRRERMNRVLLTVGGIAAAIVVVAVGVAFFDRGGRPDIGGAAPTSRSTVTATVPPSSRASAAPIGTISPTPTYRVTATPIPTVWPEPTALPSSGLVEPGRYFVEDDGYRYMFSVPERGWESEVLLDETVLRKVDQDSEEFGLLLLAGEVEPSQVIYAHPCDPEQTVDPGDTVEELASALDSLDSYDVLKPTDVSFSGYQGKRVRMFASGGWLTCPPHLFPNFDGTRRTWDGRDHKPRGWPSLWLLNYEVRILDLDGTRHLFYGAHRPGPDDELETVLNQMVDSMEIEKATADSANVTLGERAK